MQGWFRVDNFLDSGCDWGDSWLLLYDHWRKAGLDTQQFHGQLWKKMTLNPVFFRESTFWSLIVNEDQTKGGGSSKSSLNVWLDFS